MIRLFLNMGFQDEYPDEVEEICSLLDNLVEQTLDDLVEQALDNAEDTCKCDPDAPGGG